MRRAVGRTHGRLAARWIFLKKPRCCSRASSIAFQQSHILYVTLRLRREDGKMLLGRPVG